MTANVGTAGAQQGGAGGRSGLSTGMWVQLCPPLPLILLAHSGGAVSPVLLWEGRGCRRARDSAATLAPLPVRVHTPHQSHITHTLTHTTTHTINSKRPPY